jgi:hypothetical protein
MFINQLISLFNNFILLLFEFIYKWFNIETIEDKFHKHKKNNNSMNKVKIEFNKDDEFIKVKNNILNMVENKDFLTKYDISSNSILNNTNNKLVISFKGNCIYIYFNHYYISGPNMFILLNKMVNSTPPNFLQTNPFLGIINFPFYIYELMRLTKKKYVKTEKHIEHVIIENKVITENKRCYLYLSILNKVYNSLKLNRPMVVALSIAFDELPYIINNVGLIIIKYEIEDTIETIEKKLKNAYYQAYCSNFIVNFPLPNNSNIELRDYVDCIVSSMYIKSDYDFKIAWNCSKCPIEQMYIGSVSILHSDNTMDVNMCFNTCSSNYNCSYKCIDNYFE